MAFWTRHQNTLLFALAAAALAGGFLGRALALPIVEQVLWAGVSSLMLLLLLISIVRELRGGSAGLDFIAVLALLGALIMGEFLAGAVIALMLASGRALEDYAQARAQRELTALLARTPKGAHRYKGETVEDIPLDAVAAGDRLLVKPGEVIPVDGAILSPSATFDESALTGESLPVTRVEGDRVLSGTVNAGDAFQLRATAKAADSTFAGVVRLVEAARSQKAPFVRLANRYALFFVPLTLAVAALAWALSGDATRALAVLVVATPCPLILAAPVALVAGISRAARRGILIKGGGALETLARAEIMLFDKTGTLTAGLARLVRIETDGVASADEVLRLAASLDQLSQHVLAAGIVRAARERKLALSLPQNVVEQAGAGLGGLVDGRQVRLGNLTYAAGEGAPAAWTRRVLRRMSYESATAVFLAVDGQAVGALLLADEIRPESARALRSLHQAGVRRIVMVSGDHQDVAETIGSALGVDDVLAERTPADKVEAVRAERADGVTVMVGDGINDAPALAAADVGVAMGARGAGSSAEAADVVLMVDRLDRLAEALNIARRSRRIATEAVVVGMSLSIAAMVVAAIGILTPVAGAVVQEVIDLVAILLALRAVGSGARARADSLPVETARELHDEHRELEPFLERLRTVADSLDTLPPVTARAELEGLRHALFEEVLPHERNDDKELYPRLAKLLGGEDPMGSLSRAHREIHHLSRLYARHVADLPPEGPAPEDLRDLRRILYGLSAVLRLHFAQEEEIFTTMSEEGARS